MKMCRHQQRHAQMNCNPLVGFGLLHTSALAFFLIIYFGWGMCVSIICIICNLRFVWGFLSVSFLFFPISVSPSAGATQMRAVPLLSTVTDAFYLVGFFSSGVILATCRHPLRQDSKKKKRFFTHWYILW